MDNRKSSLHEIANTLGRIVLGIIIILLGLITVDLIVYLNHLDDTLKKTSVAAYESSFELGFEETYHTAFRNGYTDAYEKGYDKGYEIGLRSNFKNNIPSLVALQNPSYQELKEFLFQDKTDDNQYIPDEYISFDFAVELNNNAELHGIRAAFVTVVFPDKSHGITAFETTDRGLIFIEPQSDANVRLVTGESYWRLAGISDPAHYDDTIVEIQLIW